MRQDGLASFLRMQGVKAWLGAKGVFASKMRKLRHDGPPENQHSVAKAYRLHLNGCPWRQTDAAIQHIRVLVCRWSLHGELQGWTDHYFQARRSHCICSRQRRKRGRLQRHIHREVALFASGFRPKRRTDEFQSHLSEISRTIIPPGGILGGV